MTWLMLTASSIWVLSLKDKWNSGIRNSLKQFKQYLERVIHEPFQQSSRSPPNRCQCLVLVLRSLPQLWPVVFCWTGEFMLANKRSYLSNKTRSINDFDSKKKAIYMKIPSFQLVQVDGEFVLMVILTLKTGMQFMSSKILCPVMSFNDTKTPTTSPAK
jgi:hypothetical protein